MFQSPVNLTMKPVIVGAKMPGTVAAVLVRPISTPAYFGPMSRIYDEGQPFIREFLDLDALPNAK